MPNFTSVSPPATGTAISRRGNQLVVKAGLFKLLAGEADDGHVFGKGAKPQEPGPASGPVYSDLGSGVVIEGEYERVDEKPATTPGKTSRRNTSA